MLSQVPTPLIGREQELTAALAELTDPATRLLTLTGPVGVGKSRLAAAVVQKVLAAAPVEVWSIDLSAASDIDSLLELPAAAGAPAAGAELERPDLMLVGRSDGRCSSSCGSPPPRPGSVLLVLDNCDPVLGRAPQRLVGRIVHVLAGNPSLTVLATSRESLGVYGERRFVVGPLPVPAEGVRPPVAELEQVPSVALFVQRARAAAAGFALSADNQDDVAAVCRELDGLPLAVELAAARVRVFQPRTLLLRLRQRLDVLEGRSGDTLSRHRTMRSALAAGYDRLGPEEKAAIRRLSVFPDGFGLDGAQAVVGPAERPVDLLLESLLERSMLCGGGSGSGEPRFSLLRTTRRYALERLAEAGERAQTYRRLAGWVQAAADDPADGLVGADRAAAAEAVRWMLAGGELAEAVAVLERVAPQWLPLGRGADAQRLAQEAVRACETAGDLAAGAAANQLAGVLAAAQGEQDGAVAALRRAVALHRERGDDAGAARALTHLGQVVTRTGDTSRARRVLREAVELAGGADDAANRALALVHLAAALAADGDTATAAARAEEAARIWVEVGDRRQLARTRSVLAGIAAARADHGAAQDLARSALRVQWEVGDRAGLAPTLEVLAEQAAAADGAQSRAALLVGAAAALRDLTRTPPTPLERTGIERTTRRLATGLGAAALRQATAQGRRENLADVIECALRRTAAEPAAGTLPAVDQGPLTPREREVADLIARGMTNRQIARQLGIAEWTAVNHVRHIMRKLECPSRIHVARWMARQRD